MSLDRELIVQASRLVEPFADSPFERVSALTSDEVLAAIRTLGELSRAVDSIGAVLSAEVTRRVTVDESFRRAALGGATGGRPASELIRDLSRLDDSVIRDWETVAEAIVPRTSLQGAPLPCSHAPVADAVLAGAITARAAAVISKGVDRVAHLADAVAVEAVEVALVQYAGTVTTRELTRLVRTLPDRFDPQGAEQREELLRQRSTVTVRQLPDGIIRFIADFHPEAAGFMLTALDARTSPRRLPRFIDPQSDLPDDATPATDSLTGLDTATEDTRSLGQKRADALVAIARESIAADPGSVGGTTVTMVVTVPLQNLLDGTGTATISGIDEPISAGTARRLAADAEIIPLVLGGDSEPLDLGRSARLYSLAQRRALAVRDGGCIWPGCTAPPAWCEVAHLLAWILDGPTDLDNGALMCPHHHHRFDRDGWQLRREDGVPYLIPPPWIDPAAIPRRAGRLTAVA